MNIEGLKTLYIKEVMRFVNVYNQTIIAPVVTSLLFLAVFSLALNGHAKFIEGVPFELFMVSGLIMMTMIQNAFANTSSSFTFAKVLGSIVDYLIPPLSPFELTLAMILAGLTRGIMAGTAVALACWIFVPLQIHDVFAILFFSIFGSMLLSSIGMIAGIFSDSFDQMSALTNYIVTPLAFLSGTFYSVKNLPEFWQYVNHANPFFYLINGFRYGITGHTDADLIAGGIYIIALNIVSFYAVYAMIKAGYRIKS
jgi:ABC-2 type transport system permease protein